MTEDSFGPSIATAKLKMVIADSHRMCEWCPKECHSLLKSLNVWKEAVLIDKFLKFESKM